MMSHLISISLYFCLQYLPASMDRAFSSLLQGRMQCSVCCSYLIRALNTNKKRVWAICFYSQNILLNATFQMLVRTVCMVCLWTNKIQRRLFGIQVYYVCLLTIPNSATHRHTETTNNPNQMFCNGYYAHRILMHVWFVIVFTTDHLKFKLKHNAICNLKNLINLIKYVYIRCKLYVLFKVKTDLKMKNTFILVIYDLKFAFSLILL